MRPCHPSDCTSATVAPCSRAAARAAAAAGCQNGPAIFGYQLGADALYDPNIRTVYVPVFNNRAFQTTPHRGFEVDVTQAVVREIGREDAVQGGLATRAGPTPSCSATSSSIDKMC